MIKQVENINAEELDPVDEILVENEDELVGWNEKHSPDGDYEIYRKIIDGKGKWKAKNRATGEIFDITYDQARGYEPIKDTAVKQLSRKLGKKLLPQNEGIELEEPSDEEIPEELEILDKFNDEQEDIDFYEEDDTQFIDIANDNEEELQIKEESADYYDRPQYSKTLYLPSIRQGKVKLTIGTFSDPHYDDDHMFRILAVVETRRDDFTLDSEKVYEKLDISDGHEKLSGYDDRYDGIESKVDKIYEYFMTLDQDDIDTTLIELADDFDINRVKKMFQPLIESSATHIYKNDELRKLAKNTSSSEILSKLADNEDVYVKRMVAINPKTPQEALIKLSNDEDIDIRERIARNINTPSEVLIKLANDETHYMKLYVAGNPSTPKELLSKLARGDKYIRVQIARNPSTPSEVLDKLANDKDARVRKAVAQNSNTSRKALSKLANDESEYVRAMVKMDEDEEDLQIEEGFTHSYDRDEYEEEFTEIASKSVPDSDGFSTDYTMYRNTSTGEYVFVFGDKDIYSPEDGNFDWSCDTEEEAWEWYDSYEGISDEDEEDLNY